MSNQAAEVTEAIADLKLAEATLKDLRVALASVRNSKDGLWGWGASTKVADVTNGILDLITMAKKESDMAFLKGASQFGFPENGALYGKFNILHTLPDGTMGISTSDRVQVIRTAQFCVQEGSRNVRIDAGSEAVGPAE